MVNIEALKAAAQKAREEVLAAQKVSHAAQTALQDGFNEASGLLGHVVSYQLTRGWGRNAKTTEAKILVSRVSPSYSGVMVAYGKRIVASGEIGVINGDVEVTKAVDLGLR